MFSVDFNIWIYILFTWNELKVERKVKNSVLKFTKEKKGNIDYEKFNFI